MSNALDTVSKILRVKSQVVNLRRQEEELKAFRTQQEAEAAKQASPEFQQSQQRQQQIDKQKQVNELTQSYIKNYQNVQEIEGALGRDPQVIQAQNNAKLQLRAAMSVPLSIAVAGQHTHKSGAGEVAASSVTTDTMVLDSEGYDKDTQDRIKKLVLENGAAAHGVRMPKMSVTDQAMNLVSGYYGVPKEEAQASFEQVSVQPTAEVNTLLERVATHATETFNRLSTGPRQVGPEERLTWAVGNAMVNQKVEEAVGINEAYFIVNTVMERLERRQTTRVQKALSQLPALNRMYEEEAAVVLQDFMMQASQAGGRITYDNLMDSIGENEMLMALRNPEGLGDTYRNIKKTLGTFNQNYENISSERDRFNLFVGAFADFAAHNVNSGTPIRDQYQLGALERLRTASETGQLYAKFEGLVAPLEELWAGFEAQHNSVVIKRNEAIAGYTNAGRTATVTYDGSIVSWMKRTPEEDQRFKQLVNDPAVYDLLSDQQRIKTDSRGNKSLDIVDLDTNTLGVYADAVNAGADWFNIVVQPAAGPNVPAVTLNSFSDTGKETWGAHLAAASAALYGNNKFFTALESDAQTAAKQKGTTWVDRVSEVGNYKDIPIGTIIANSSELSMALKNAKDDRSKIEAVINSALVMHIRNVDATVMRTGSQARTEIINDVIQDLPSELRQQAEHDFTYGSTRLLQQVVPQMESEFILARKEYDDFRETEMAEAYLTGRQANLSAALEGKGGIGQVLDSATANQLQELRNKELQARSRILNVRNKLNNYIHEIDKKGEVTNLSEQLGIVPPRAWAFIDNSGELIEHLDRVLK